MHVSMHDMIGGGYRAIREGWQETGRFIWPYLATCLGWVLVMGLVGPLVPSPFQVFVSLWVILQHLTLLLGMALGARLWLTVLVGVLLSQSVILGLCVSALISLMETCPR